MTEKGWGHMQLQEDPPKGHRPGPPREAGERSGCTRSQPARPPPGVPSKGQSRACEVRTVHHPCQPTPASHTQGFLPSGTRASLTSTRQSSCRTSWAVTTWRPLGRTRVAYSQSKCSSQHQKGHGGTAASTPRSTQALRGVALTLATMHQVRVSPSGQAPPHTAPTNTQSDGETAYRPQKWDPGALPVTAQLAVILASRRAQPLFPYMGAEQEQGGARTAPQPTHWASQLALCGRQNSQGPFGSLGALHLLPKETVLGSGLGPPQS